MQSHLLGKNLRTGKSDFIDFFVNPPTTFRVLHPSQAVFVREFILVLYNTFMLTGNIFPLQTRKKIIKSISIFSILLIYFAYALIVIQINQGPVDFETFMEIGKKLLLGSQIYTDNSFYPMPFVGIFSIFSLIPFPFSFLIWVFLPVFLALIISGWSPVILLFAPLFAHFAGGQTALFGMLGLWGYRKNQKSKWAGVWLAILLLKPQLAIAPIVWASYGWVRDLLKTKKISSQMIVFLVSSLLIFLPWFFIYPTWFSDWLANPRSLRLRAMAGLVPRILMYFGFQNWIYAIILFCLLITFVYILKRRNAINLDSSVLLSFIILPIVHDYDLIQIIPILDDGKKQIVAFLSSIPLWLTIFFAYRNDHAWITASIIAPILMIYLVLRKRNEKIPDPA